MARHFNDLQPASEIVHATVLYDDVTAYWESYRSKTQHQRLLAAINRGVEYIVRSRDINLGCIYEILSDANKPYIDDQWLPCLLYHIRLEHIRLSYLS